MNRLESLLSIGFATAIIFLSLCDTPMSPYETAPRLHLLVNGQETDTLLLTVGDTVNVQIEVENNVELGSFEVTPGLPRGLQLDAEKRRIYGTVDSVTGPTNTHTVTGINSWGSSVTSITIIAVPQTPTNFEARRIAEDVVRISWDLSLGADSVAIYRSLEEEVVRFHAACSGNEFRDSGAFSSGVVYYYRVAAKGAFTHYSEPSEAVELLIEQDWQPSGLVIATDDFYTIDEDDTLSADTTGGIGENDVFEKYQLHTYEMITEPQHGTVELTSDGAIFYIPEQDFNGRDSLRYRLSGGAENQDTAWVFFTVKPVNDLPRVFRDGIAVDVNGTATVDVLENDSDPDGDSLYVSQIIAIRGGGTVGITPEGLLRYSPGTDYVGMDTVEYDVSDGTVTVPGILLVAVGITNTPPTATNDSIVTAEDSSLMIAVLANDFDVDGQDLMVASVGFATLGEPTISGEGDAVLYTPHQNASGIDTFTYTISDNMGETDSAIVVVTIREVNDPPVARDDVFEVPEDSVVEINPVENDSDIDQDSLSISDLIWFSGESRGFPTSRSTFRYKPEVNFVGFDTVQYIVQDDRGGSDTALVTIKVIPRNDAPVAVADTIKTKR